MKTILQNPGQSIFVAVLLIVVVSVLATLPVNQW